MTAPAAVLDTAHDAISKTASVLAAVIAALGDQCARATSHLKMGEMDLLSARDAVEKARWQIDLSGRAEQTRVQVPRGVASIAIPRVGATRAGPAVSAGATVPLRRRAGRRAPGHGQAELFPLDDILERDQYLVVQ